MIQKLVTLTLGVLVARSAVAFASAQSAPPHRFYGSDGNAGDTIGVHAADLTLLDSTTVAEDGSWYVDVDSEQAEGAVISINETPVEAEITSTGSNQSSVSLAAALEKLAMQAEEDAMDDESMDGEEGDAMDDGMEDDSMSDDSMDSDDSMSDDSMDDGMDSDDSMSDHAYPETGSGGLADTNGVSAGLIGLLLTLSAAAIVGIGLRRVRNRA